MQVIWQPGREQAAHLIDVRQRILLWMRNRAVRNRDIRPLVVAVGWRRRPSALAIRADPASKYLATCGTAMRNKIAKARWNLSAYYVKCRFIS
jgi:hypothetical protein